MATSTTQQPRTSQQSSTSNQNAPIANSQLVSPSVGAATSGLVDSLNDSAKARIQYGS